MLGIRNRHNRGSQEEYREKDERAAITRIALMRACKPEAKKLIKLIRNRQFTTSLKLQREAALLFQGIDMKMAVLDANAELRDHGDLRAFLNLIAELRGQYSQVYNRIPIDVTSGDQPFQPMQALLDAIDGKTRGLPPKPTRK